MQDKKQKLPKGQESIVQDIEAIKKALLGDDYSQEGLIARFSGAEARLQRLEKILDRSRFALLGLTLFACGGIYEWIKKVLHMLLEK